MAQRFSNNAVSLLDSAISSAAASISVTSGTGNLFPVAGSFSPGGSDWFKVAITDDQGALEIVYVNTRAPGSSEFSNCLRGQEETAARQWPAGSYVRLAATAADLEKGLLAFPSGTRLLFQQSVAPPGWTKEIVHNDATLRVVTGSATVGGSVAFSTVFSNRTISGTIAGTALTIDQMPAHGHSLFQTAASFSSKVFNEASMALNVGTSVQSTRTWNDRSASPDGEVLAATAGGSQAHTHAFTGANMDLRIKYVDVIIGIKD